MGRKRSEINPIRGKRLRALIEELDMSNRDFGEAVNYSPEHISYMIHGTRNLTEDAARRIANKFPIVRAEWLLGYDDYKTTEELFRGFISESQYEAQTLMTGLQSFAKLSGFRIEITSPVFSDGKRSAPIETVLKAIKDGYTITSNDGRKAVLSADEMNELQNEICDYVEFKLNRFCNKGGNNG